MGRLLDGAFMFGDSNPGNIFPFWQFFFFNGETQSGCNSKLSRANVRIGRAGCNDSQFWYEADPGVYSRSTDWPWGSWGCVRGHFQGLGTSNTRIKIWFTGPAGAEKLITDISGIDTTRMGPEKVGPATAAIHGMLIQIIRNKIAAVNLPVAMRTTSISPTEHPFHARKSHTNRVPEDPRHYQRLATCASDRVICGNHPPAAGSARPCHSRCGPGKIVSDRTLNYSRDFSGPVG